MKNPAAIARTLPAVAITGLPNETARVSMGVHGQVMTVARLAIRQQFRDSNTLIDFDLDGIAETDEMKQAMERATRIR